MTYAPNSDPMTADEAAAYIPQWGSYLTSGDPGYIAYTAIPPEKAAHRDEMVRYLKEHCLPIATRDGGTESDDGDGDFVDDETAIARAVAYLEGLTYSADCKFIASSFGGGWLTPIGDEAREYLEGLLGEEPAPLAPIGGQEGWIIEPAELAQVRADLAADGKVILEA